MCRTAIGLIHRCNGCDVLDSNRAAGDDHPLLVRTPVRPLAMPPLPLDRLLPDIDGG